MCIRDSPEIIKKPVYGKGKTYNDYGRGFYCTEHLELANDVDNEHPALVAFMKYQNIEALNLSLIHI